jgi:hypothetical protein
MPISSRSRYATSRCRAEIDGAEIDRAEIEERDAGSRKRRP